MEQNTSLEHLKMASKPSENFEKFPWFWIIAGPNGSGKSTWADSKDCKDIIGNIPILNPDKFSEAYTSNPLSHIAAGKKIFHEIERLTQGRKDFAIETTLAGKNHFRLATTLKNSGWCIGSIYIGVEGEDICVSRVLERELKGGHSVPLKDVVRRYKRSLCHLPKLLSLADYMMILDNSKGYEKMLETVLGETTIKKSPPAWLKNIFYNEQSDIETKER